MSEQETGPTEAPRHRPEHSEGSWLPLPLGDGRAGTCYSKLVAMMKEEASPATLKHITLLIQDTDSDSSGYLLGHNTAESAESQLMFTLPASSDSRKKAA
jgi:hypothetical protein